MEAPPLAALLVLAAVLVPLAGGGLPLFSSTNPPPTDTVQLDVENVYTLSPGRPATANVTVTLCAPAGGLVAGPRQVEVVAPDAPQWLSFRVEPQAFTFAAVLPGECDTAKGVARLNATAEAPAFDVVRVDVHARDAQDGGTRDVHDYYFRVGYYGDLNVTPTHTRVTAALNTPTPLELTVTNEGNAETTFNLEVPGPRNDVSVMRPQPLVLAPGETDTWTVFFVLPSGSGLQDRSLDLLVTSHARMDHTASGGSHVVKVDFDPRPGAPSGLSTPGFVLLGALAAGGAAAGLRLARSRG